MNYGPYIRLYLRLFVNAHNYGHLQKPDRDGPMNRAWARYIGPYGRGE